MTPIGHATSLNMTTCPTGEPLMLRKVYCEKQRLN